MSSSRHPMLQPVAARKPLPVGIVVKAAAIKNAVIARIALLLIFASP